MAVAFPDVPPGEDVTISATAFLTWLRCPERALARIEGTYDAGSMAAFRGVVAHRVFARHLVAGPIEPSDLRQVCREEIGKGLNPSMVSLGLRPSEVDAVVEEVRELYASFIRVPVAGLRHVEVQIDEEAAPGLRLRGVVDAVFTDDAAQPESIRLTDWKTGKLGDAAVQLAFYALLWTLHDGSAPARVEAISVASGERHEARPTPETLAGTAREVARMATDVRLAHAAGERLERVAGPWCRSCPLLAECDEGAAAIAILGA